jgi:hypothetical protein
MAAQDQDSVRAHLESLQNELRIDPSAAHDPHNLHVGLEVTLLPAG